MINTEKMDEIMLQLGHTDNIRGCQYLREGIRLYDAGCRAMTKEVYPAIAEAHGTKPSRIERSMRHSIERAWERGSVDAQHKWFGYTIDPNRGRPTVGEYCARMAVICRED